MSSQTGRTSNDVTERMHTQARLFTLGQVLRLHAMQQKGKEQKDAVTVRPWLSLAFPSTELYECFTKEDEQGYKELVVSATHFGLYGTLGALPTFYTEELMEEERQDSSVSRDFLDIINSRLFQLLSEAQKHYNIGLHSMERQSPQIMTLLYALMGQLQNVAQSNNIALETSLIEFLAGKRRTAAGLALFLRIVLHEKDLHVQQCVQTTVPIQPDQRCLLGQQAAQLGSESVIGAEISDRTTTFAIHIAQLSEKTVQAYLPESKKYCLLTKMVRYYLDIPLPYRLVLEPKQDLHPQPVLGISARTGAYLGTMAAQYASITIYPQNRG
jgi:type VI secretion system protein ImpH